MQIRTALSGSELALLATLSPWFLTYPSISRFSTSRRGTLILRALSLAFGLGAYKLPLPSLRLLAVVLGNVFAWMEVAATSKRLKGGDAARMEGSCERVSLVHEPLRCANDLRASDLMLGLIGTLVLKLINNSVNPLWCIVDEVSGGRNKTGIVLASVAFFEKMVRSNRDQPQAPNPRDVKEAADPEEPLSTLQRQSIIAGIGSLIFLVQTFVTDAGTIIAWNWTGFPVTGPRLLWQGSLVIGSAALGLIARWAQDRTWSRRARPYSLLTLTTTILACSTFCGHYKAIIQSSYPDVINWVQFGGGCALVASLVYHFPALWQELSRYDYDGRLLCHALGFNAALDVISVITVAYAFVPGGHLLREKMAEVVFLTTACIFNAGFVLDKLSSTYKTTFKESQSLDRRYKRLFFHGSTMLVAFIAVAELFCRQRRDGIVVKPHHEETGVWTSAIWTVHFGVDLAGRDSQKRMLDLIRDAEVDVLGLLETDLHRFVYGNRDLTRMISEELGYYVDIGPGPNKHTWGAVLLSKFPILESTHHLLPSPRGELAPAISAKLLVNNQVVNVIVSHNGQEEDPKDRELQTQAIAKISNSCWPEPFVFLGYVVTRVGAKKPAPYEILMADGRLWDIEIADRDRWCEYIAFRNLWRVAYARVSHGDITDTEMQLAKFVTLDSTLPVDYQSNDDLYYHTYEKALPESWQFPQKFRGNGTR